MWDRNICSYGNTSEELRVYIHQCRLYILVTGRELYGDHSKNRDQKFPLRMV